jgi:hypothetical protein
MYSNKSGDERAEALQRIAPCGLHCGKCFAFADGEIHAAALTLQRCLGNFGPYAERFTKALDPVFADYPAFDRLLRYIAAADCGGCRREKCRFYTSCRVRSCTAARGIDFCCQCDAFPCGQTGLDDNLAQRSVAINRRIAEIGLEAYYREVKDQPRY